MNNISGDSQTGSEKSRTAEGEAGRNGASSGQPPQSPSLVKKRVKVYPEKTNRLRAWKPKTRSGCRTCKYVSTLPLTCSHRRPEASVCRQVHRKDGLLAEMTVGFEE
jgi:hypothetical protein